MQTVYQVFMMQNNVVVRKYKGKLNVHLCILFKWESLKLELWNRNIMFRILVSITLIIEKAFTVTITSYWNRNKTVQKYFLYKCQEYDFFILLLHINYLDFNTLQTLWMRRCRCWNLIILENVFIFNRSWHKSPHKIHI